MSRRTHGHRSTSRFGADVPSTVLFDLYGTLVEPDWPALLRARAALAERAGVDPAAAHRAWDATHAARMTGAHGSLAGDLAAIFAEASAGAPSDLSPSLLARLAERELEAWRREVRVYADVTEALGLLRSAGSRLAIVTNASVEAASVVDALNLRSLVDAVFASCERGILKPALLGVALEGLGAEAADVTLVDDEPSQLDGAARVGIATILIRRGPNASAATIAAGPHQSVNDLRQVAAFVLPQAPARPR
jgi:FMN phosphatase YigB (HAD superfamily)